MKNPHPPHRTSRQARRRRVIRLTTAAIVCIATATLALPVTPALADWSKVGSLPGLGGGRIWSLAVAPNDPNLILAGTDNGVYHSSDGGVAWKASTLTHVRVTTVGFDIRDPQHMYAGTAGQGIKTSTDGGVIWRDVSMGLSNRNVRSMAFGLSQIAAGTDDGVSLSVNGDNWTRSGLAGVSVNSLAVVANFPDLKLIAGTDSGDTRQGYLWVNSGSTWKVDRGSGLPAAAVVLSLTSGPVSQAITNRPIVVDISTDTGQPGQHHYVGESLRSLDGGQTWSPATNLPSVGTEQLPLTTSSFSPLDPSVVYSGADASGSSGGAMLRSSDSGVTYVDVSSGLPPTKKNVVSIAVAPTNPPTVYIAVNPPASGGLVYKVTDSGAPPPPQLIAEQSGAPMPTSVATPTPTPRPTPHPTSSTAQPKASSGFIVGLFHWPQPLIYEMIGLLLLIYAYIRWRQHNYVEGPP